METKYLEIHDLANVLNLIDAAAKQGLISGDQLLVIGAMRQRFHAELKEQAPEEGNVANISDENLAKEHAEVQAIASTVWTQEVKDSWNAFKIEQGL